MKFNKILLVVASFLALAVSSIGQNNIGTLVTDPIRPFSVSSTHPSAIANEIKGGPFTSSNLAGLSNIPAPRLEIGAIGYATNTGLYYRLTATNPATWSSIDGVNITNLNASNITGSIPFLNISNALTNANVAFGTATFNNQVVLSAGTVSVPAVRFGGTNLNFGIFQGTLVGFGNWLGIASDGVNIARFQSNRVYLDQPIAFASPTSGAALTTRTNLGIQDFVTNPVVQVVSGGTGATNAGGARTNLELGALWLTNTVASNFRTAIGATTIGNALFTATNQAAAIDAIGISTNFGDQVLSVSNIQINQFPAGVGTGFVIHNAGQRLQVVGTNVTTAVPAFYGWNGFAQTAFSTSEARTNLELAWPALTNSNAGTGLVSVNTNGEVVSPTNFWQRAPIQTTVQDFTGITVNQTNNATNARNVYVYSLATNVSGISNTIILPTNTLTFNGDEVTVVHKGTTNTTTVVRQAGATNNLITLNKFDESVKFIRELGQWDFYHNIGFVEPIQFSGTNTAANAAASRTNLGLGITNNVEFNQIRIGGSDQMHIRGAAGNISFYDAIDNENVLLIPADTDPVEINSQWNDGGVRSNLGLGLPALTNTSNTTFQQAIFTTNAAPTNAGNFGNHAAWMGVSIVTNGVTNTFLIPLYK